MPELIAKLLSTGSFIPHGHCYLWQSQLVWLHILSDSLIALAYYSIPITLVYFVYKRKDLPFNWIFLMFGAFIVSCGTTHLMEIWTLWYPTYWLSGLLKAVTALISLYTAISLVQLIPQALSIPSPQQLYEVNKQLIQQISDREQAEAEVRQLNQTLEAKVARRTAELQKSIAQVQDYVERTNLAMDAAKMGSWDWDLSCDQIIWSPHFEILWGYQPGIANRSYEEWSKRIHPDDLPSVEAAIEQARVTNTDFLEEYRVVLDNDIQRWIAAVGRFSLKNGQPTRMLGMVQDITERKGIEDALRDSEERFRTLADNMSQLAWMADRNGSIFWFNQRWFDYTGTTLAEMQGWGWQQVHHPEYLDPVLARFRHCINAGQIWEDTFPLRGQDGMYRWFLSRAIPITNAEGKILRWFGTNTDITDIKQAQATLEKQNQELDSFVHIVSHDLKAPLRAIANLSQWIEEDIEESLSADSQAQMTLLRDRVSRMQAMINGLLTYARVTRSQIPVEPVVIAELLSEVIDSIDPPPTFNIDFPANFPTILTKRLLLFQVFSNLISNSVKHHDRPDGSIQISVQMQHNFCVFTIMDDGPGIDPRYQANIFTIFQTANSPNSGDSTGVGLAIVQKIVDAEGGIIRLESELGNGTKFYISWPIFNQI